MSSCAPRATRPQGFQRRMRLFRGAARAVGALIALYGRAAHRVNAPGGAGFEEARSDFQRQLVQKMKAASIAQET